MLKIEHSHTHPHCMGISFHKKKNWVTFFLNLGKHKKYQACISLFFLRFYHFRVQKMWKGKWLQVYPPLQANNSVVQKEFCRRRICFCCFSVQRSSHWSCRSSQSCASRSRRKNVSSAISQTTTKKRKFRHFPWVHRYDFSSCAPTMSLSKRKKEINFSFLHMFHSPRVASEVQFCFLFTSLLKLFLNFRSRYLLNTWDVRTSETPRTES